MGLPRHVPRLACLAAAILLAACGAKTGLEIPDASEGFDAGTDAGTDAGIDAGTDAGMCEPTPVALERRGAQVMYVVDRSNSMDDTLEGDDRPPGDPRPSRWEILGGTLEEVLLPEDPLLEVGAEFYPAGGGGTAAEACMVDPSIDLVPAPGNTRRFLSFFTETLPSGGTPTAVALQNVRDFLSSRPTFVPRFVILATDGGPNCNPDPPVGPPACVCTGRPEACAPDIPEDIRVSNCLDAERTYDVVRELFEALGVPVYVIGIDDPSRPDLADVLDQMAILGGRPRDADLGGRRFYSVRRPADLRGALETITDSIALCVFTTSPRPTADAELDVRIDGVRIPRDPSRTEGWDFTRGDRSELTLFGGACERVTRSGGEIVVEQTCPDE